ncbi:synaptic vesicle glycoprotein 2C isoform X2 [Mobula birostris]|uniref:synaptic vesicle glycoprotein 2C isoform X2 n=1 Tax=Mobula birostris TaxID=1983395 RepID=UPI003B281B55
MRGRMSSRDREPLLELGDLDDPVRGTIFEQYGSEMSDLRENDEIALTFEEAVKESGFGMFHMLLLVICGWANASDAVEILCVSFLLPTARCDLHLNTADMGWLTASIFLGMMIGGYMWGALADLKGRQRILVLSLAVNGVCGAASSLAPNYWTFLMLRFFSGVGVGGSIPVIFSYFSEFQPQHRRGCMVSALATFWMAGNILAAGLAWLVIPRSFLSFQLGSLHIQSWRIFVVLCSIPSLSSALLYALGMPESPKYLMETGQEEEALRVFRWMFWWNHRGTAHTLSVHRLLIPAVEKSSTKLNSDRPDWLRGQLLKGLDPIHKLFSQRHRSTSIAFSIIFFSISFGFYGLWMWFPELLKQMESTGGSCSSNWSSQSSKGVENITCYPVKTAGASLFLSGLSVFFIWEVKTKSQSLIMSCVFSAISVIAWNSLDVIGLELYPTHLRSSAFGVFSGISRIASILGNVAFGQLVDVNCTVPILLVALILFIGSLAGLKLPHIKNKELS